MDSEQLAWAAGFFDGEGCVVIKRRFPTAVNRQKNINHILATTIGSTDKPVLELCKRLFGGSISRQVPRNGWAMSWKWNLTTTTARSFLESILPYLKVKDKEVICALEFHDLLRITTNRFIRIPLEVVAQRDAYYWRLRELKETAKTYD